ncbi:hypothetical protein H696_06012 [Fonticula alba]|uniref:THIF-type NAD/FAD binding fold domain-containing protein n=1 Tax=Fonticula alba TaxID=691883 RepID=A0A058Z1Y1_FONAL|nr:hypothetical protein H696_06012 [Fonticula alba]KCV67492.1 hypothetical protein H696_06012 [Fonticula alba]|eukprot:XP_009498053.1 hypothetical protein H696_06012 [Fonticula alba]
MSTPPAAAAAAAAAAAVATPFITSVVSDEDSRLYDRQIRLWGFDAQARIKSAHVLVAGNLGTATVDEFLKNLVLAGVGRVTLLDAGALVVPGQCESQFLLRDYSVGQLVADEKATHLAILNPQVDIRVARLVETADEQPAAMLARLAGHPSAAVSSFFHKGASLRQWLTPDRMHTEGFTCVSVFDVDADTLVAVNEACRRVTRPGPGGSAATVPLVAVTSAGSYGSVFLDCGPSHVAKFETKDASGQSQTITQEIAYVPYRTAAGVQFLESLTALYAAAADDGAITLSSTRSGPTPAGDVAILFTATHGASSISTLVEPTELRAFHQKLSTTCVRPATSALKKRAGKKN